MTTTAGRVLQVSEPRVGSRSTHQTSPRAGSTSSIRKEISAEQCCPLLVLDVVIARAESIASQAVIPLTRWQLHEIATVGRFRRMRSFWSHADHDLCLIYSKGPFGNGAQSCPSSPLWPLSCQGLGFFRLPPSRIDLLPQRGGAALADDAEIAKPVDQRLDAHPVPPLEQDELAESDPAAGGADIPPDQIFRRKKGRPESERCLLTINTRGILHHQMT